MSINTYANDEMSIKKMIEDIGYELRERTIVRLSNDVATELAVSAKEFLDNQPIERREFLTKPVNEIAAEVARQISNTQKESDDVKTK